MKCFPFSLVTKMSGIILRPTNVNGRMSRDYKWNLSLTRTRKNRCVNFVRNPLRKVIRPKPFQTVRTKVWRNSYCRLNRRKSVNLFAPITPWSRPGRISVRATRAPIAAFLNILLFVFQTTNWSADPGGYKPIGCFPSHPLHLFA